jgi:dynein light chain 1
VRDFTEIERLASAEKLEDLLLVGNPIYNDYKDNNTLAEYRVEVREP